MLPAAAYQESGELTRMPEIDAGRARSRAGRRRGAAALLATALLTATCSPPEAVELDGWNASDESNTASIDHGPWQEILQDHIDPDPSGVNLFDYAGLAASSSDAAKLAGYLESLEEIDPRDYSRREQFAYWVNFYNALTVKVVVDAYPVESILDIHEGIVPLTGPWGDVHANVAGQGMTLDEIEHGILRPIWRDARIHYAVNCAAYSCPNLTATAFTAANSEALLEAGAQSYVNSPRGVDVVADDFIALSSIYDWYTEDFGGTEAAVIEHLIAYADGELAAVLRGFPGAIEYRYDWSLNERER